MGSNTATYLDQLWVLNILDTENHHGWSLTYRTYARGVSLPNYHQLYLDNHQCRPF